MAKRKLLIIALSYIPAVFTPTLILLNNPKLTLFFMLTWVLYILALVVFTHVLYIRRKVV